MDKAIELVLKVLPLPVLIGVAALFALAWLIKEFREYRSYKDVLKGKVFYYAALAVILSILLFNIFSKSDESYESKICIADFSNDPEKVIPAHLQEVLSRVPRAGSTEGFGLLNLTFKEKQDAINYCKSIDARACIWGTMIPPESVWITVFITSTESIVDLPLLNYLDHEVIGQAVSSILEHVPPAENDLDGQIDMLERTLAFIQEENSQLRSRLAILEHQLAIGKVASATKPEGITLQGKIFGPNETPRQRSMLAIGVGKYNDESQFLPVTKAASDANRMAQMLKKSWGNHAEESNLILDEEATKSNIIQSLDAFASSLRPADQAWVYLAGHAVTKRGRGFIAPYDVRITDGEPDLDTLIPAEYVVDWFLNLPVGQAVMMVDTCFAGYFLGPMSRGIVLNAGSLADDSLEGLAEGRVIFVASGRDELAYEEQEGGVFTSALIEGLYGEADYTMDGLVTVSELSIFTRQYTSIHAREYSRATTPLIWSNVDLGDLLLTRASKDNQVTSANPQNPIQVLRLDAETGTDPASSSDDSANASTTDDPPQSAPPPRPE